MGARIGMESAGWVFWKKTRCLVSLSLAFSHFQEHKTSMQNQQADIQRDSETEPAVIRKLGATEHLFWLIDRNRPIHFSLVAQIDWIFTHDAWRAALHMLQQRHPLLSARIAVDAGSSPVFHHDSDARIPLQIIDDARLSWQEEVAREMTTAVNWWDAPLVRATVLQGASESTLILCAHHAVLDGMGGAYLIEALLRTLSENSFDLMQLAPSLVPSFETLLSTQMQAAALPGAMVPAPVPREFRPMSGARAEVAALALDAPLTQALVERARKEGTTVHGAVAAAVHEAGRRLSPAWRSRPIRTVTPIDVRKAIDGVGKACGVYITQTITIDDRKLGAPFWLAAREVKALLAPAQVHQSVVSETKALDAFMSSNPSVDDAAGFLSHALAFDVLLSNLGSEPIEAAYEGVSLKSLWGPFVSSGFADDQVVGVCTLGGILRLSHTSYDALPGLLDEVHRVLREAVNA